MSADVIATRGAEAVRALEAARASYRTIDLVREAPATRPHDIVLAMNETGDRAALHALALLLAAMTEPT